MTDTDPERDASLTSLSGFVMLKHIAHRVRARSAVSKTNVNCPTKSSLLPMTSGSDAVPGKAIPFWFCMDIPHVPMSSATGGLKLVRDSATTTAAIGRFKRKMLSPVSVVSKSSLTSMYLTVSTVPNVLLVESHDSMWVISLFPNV